MDRERRERATEVAESSESPSRDSEPQVEVETATPKVESSDKKKKIVWVRGKDNRIVQE